MGWGCNIFSLSLFLILLCSFVLFFFVFSFVLTCTCFLFVSLFACFVFCLCLVLFFQICFSKDFAHRVWRLSLLNASCLWAVFIVWVYCNQNLYVKNVYKDQIKLAAAHCFHESSILDIWLGSECAAANVLILPKRTWYITDQTN